MHTSKRSLCEICDVSGACMNKKQNCGHLLNRITHGVFNVFLRCPVICLSIGHKHTLGFFLPVPLCNWLNFNLQ
jgi:hypothetical protein